MGDLIPFPALKSFKRIPLKTLDQVKQLIQEWNQGEADLFFHVDSQDLFEETRKYLINNSAVPCFARNEAHREFWLSCDDLDEELINNGL